MPFNYQPLQIPFQLSAAESGTSAPDYVGSLLKGFQAGMTPKMMFDEVLKNKLQNQIQGAKAKFAEQNEQANLQKTLGGNRLTDEQIIARQLENKYFPREKEASLRSSSSQEDLRQQDILRQKILNEFLPESEQARIKEMGARGEYYQSGGSSGSTGSKDFMNYKNSVIKDNPNLSPEQQNEAANAIAEGRTELPDGTKLNPPSFETRTALNRAIKATTTAQQLNTGLGANQAEAEIDVLQKFANKALKPYGDTYNDLSPQQVLDTFKTDRNSQLKLGKFIGGQGLTFEIAQQRIKLANGQPGVTSTNELVNLSKQAINAKYPRLSGIAREEAARFMNEALSAGLKARSKIGIGGSYLEKTRYEANKSSNQQNSGATLRYNLQTGRFE